MKVRANTLLNPWLIFCAWLVLWAARVWLIPAYYQRTDELGYYPEDADSMAIPIVASLISTITLAPFFALALWLLLRRSPVDTRTWFAWNRQRWAISLAWTVLFGLLAVLSLWNLRTDIHVGLPFGALADVGWFFLWVAVRAMVVSRSAGYGKGEAL